MRIGIIVAMSTELNLLLPLIEDEKQESVNGIAFHIGKIGRNEVVVMQCGIGKVNAAMGELTRIVVGERVAYHDVWCGPGTEIGQVQGLPRFFEADGRLLNIEALRGFKNVKFGLIASGDCFVDSPEVMGRIKSIYPEVKAVDMESASVAQVCYVRNVPFTSIRVLSDTPGEVNDNTSQYLDFWSKAPRQTFDVLKALLENIQ